MKIREDFVTNSSSSSFIIAKKHLTDMQIEAIKHHSELAERMNWDRCGWYGPWSISETDTYIEGTTDMDNFDMCNFLDYIGVPDDYVDWNELDYEKYNYPDEIPEWVEELERILEEE